MRLRNPQFRKLRQRAWVMLPFQRSLAWMCVGGVLLGIGTDVLAEDSSFRLVSTEGEVRVFKSGAGSGQPVALKAPAEEILGFGDQVVTGEHSRAVIRKGNEGIVVLNEFSSLEIPMPITDDEEPGEISLMRGLLFFFSREANEKMRIKTPSAVGAIRGTEFVVEVQDSGASLFWVLAGNVMVSNSHGAVDLGTAEAGRAVRGQAPVKTAVIETTRLLQWNLYYPGVLEPDLIRAEIGGEDSVGALRAYQAGDLAGALQILDQQKGRGETVSLLFHAAVLLAHGQVDEARQLLAGVEDGPGKTALENSIATVLGEKRVDGAGKNTRTPSELMALSYHQQSIGNMEGSLSLVDQALKASPRFAFAAARRAELTFALGRQADARSAARLALELGPRNAQAHAVMGFILAKDNEMGAAERSFVRAVELDPALANGWLGLGLVSVFRGEADLGRAYLLTAASREPNRALIRSYLARLLMDEGKVNLAQQEADRAVGLDPQDPATFFAKGLVELRSNRLNEAVRDFERSVLLNDNRRIFRSRADLVNDSGIRRTNLAAAYRKAGLSRYSLREAMRSVHQDYLNARSHLFLANAFRRFRDPRGIELRYEPLWLGELQIANLLAPAGTAALARGIGLEDYASLLSRGGARFNLRSEYRDNGDIFTQASFADQLDRFSYAIDVDSSQSNGYRTNNEWERLDVGAVLKWELSESDSLFIGFQGSRLSAGDVLLDPLPAFARPSLRFEESVAPQVAIGLRHHWSDESVTLFQATYSHARQKFSDNQAAIITLGKNAVGNVIAVASLPFDRRLDTELDLFTAELIHIQEWEKWRLIAGLRAQFGSLKVHNVVSNPPFPVLFAVPPADVTLDESYQRIGAYSYLHYRPVPELLLIAGGGFNRIRFPSNFRLSPISTGEASISRFLPKAGFLWEPGAGLLIRAAYAESLGGVSFDNSLTLEPSQLAGFAQSFRTLISESLIGSVSGPLYRTGGLGATWRITESLYFDTAAEIRRASVDRRRGAFTVVGAPPFFPDSFQETVRYQEQNLHAVVTHLLGNQFSFSVGHEWTRSDLDLRFPELIANPVLPPEQFFGTVKNETWGSVKWNHSSGWFVDFDVRNLEQGNRGGLSFDESVVLMDAACGYRSPTKPWELRTGVLNLSDQMYQISPLGYFQEVPRARTFFVQFTVNL